MNRKVSYLKTEANNFRITGLESSREWIALAFNQSLPHSDKGSPITMHLEPLFFGKKFHTLSEVTKKVKGMNWFVLVGIFLAMVFLAEKTKFFQEVAQAIYHAPLIIFAGAVIFVVKITMIKSVNICLDILKWIFNDA